MSSLLPSFLPSFLLFFLLSFLPYVCVYVMCDVCACSFLVCGVRSVHIAFLFVNTVYVRCLYIYVYEYKYSFTKEYIQKWEDNLWCCSSCSTLRKGSFVIVIAVSNCVHHAAVLWASSHSHVSVSCLGRWQKPVLKSGFTKVLWIHTPCSCKVSTLPTELSSLTLGNIFLYEQEIESLTLVSDMTTSYVTWENVYFCTYELSLFIPKAQSPIPI